MEEGFVALDEGLRKKGEEDVRKMSAVCLSTGKPDIVCADNGCEFEESALLNCIGTADAIQHCSFHHQLLPACWVLPCVRVDNFTES
mmetsp:Transcript_1954/g.3709  ORF Transcript_1954/g.3709 Transcript_1954/m.3709 type:complete len:87 (+) Transcript_1954:1049-1309(+)